MTRLTHKTVKTWLARGAAAAVVAAALGCGEPKTEVPKDLNKQLPPPPVGSGGQKQKQKQNGPGSATSDQ